MKRKFLGLTLGFSILLGVNAFAETTIEPTVLVDQDGVTITAKEITCKDGRSGELKLLIENKSDKNISIVSGSLGFNQNAMNGYMSNDFYINVDIAAGKKTTETVDFGAWYNKYMDFQDVASITLSFQVDDDDYNHLFYSEPVEIKTSSFDNYNFDDDPFERGIQDKGVQDYLGYDIIEFKKDGMLAIDGLEIKEMALINNSDEKQVLFEVENTTDEMMVMGIDGLTIDNVSVYSGNWDSARILPHTKKIMDVKLNSIAEENYASSIGYTADSSQIAVNLVTKTKDYDEMNRGMLNLIGTYDYEQAEIKGSEIYADDNVQIYACGIVDDERNNDKHFVGIARNLTDIDVDVKADRGSFSVDDTMIDISSWGSIIRANSIGVFEFEIDGDSLEDNDITDFSSGEFVVKVIDDNWNTVADTNVNFNF